MQQGQGDGRAGAAEATSLGPEVPGQAPCACTAGLGKGEGTPGAVRRLSGIGDRSN
jgi:hypothetical protein